MIPDECIARHRSRGLASLFIRSSLSTRSLLHALDSRSLYHSRLERSSQASQVAQINSGSDRKQTKFDTFEAKLLTKDNIRYFPSTLKQALSLPFLISSSVASSHLLNSSHDSPSLPTFPLPPLCATSFRSLLLPNLIFLLPSSLAPDSSRSFSIPTPFPCLRIEYSP